MISFKCILKRALTSKKMTGVVKIAGLQTLNVG